MQKLRSLTVGLGALALLAAANAQFDGPAPLAWRWMQPTSVAPGGSPLVSADTVYQSLGGRIYCIDRTTGNKRWQYPQLDPIAGTFRSTPVLVDDTLVAIGDNKIAYAVNPTTGESKWSVNLPSGAIGTPAVVGKYLLIGLSDNTIVSVDTEKGSLTWDHAYHIDDGISGSLAATSDDVLVMTGRNEMLAIDVTGPKIHWRQRFSQLTPNPVAVVSKEAIYLNSGNYLIALNPANGVARWQAPAPMQLALSPVLGTNTILVVTQDGKAVVYDAATHKPINKNPIDIGTVPVVKPTAVGDKYVLLTANGGINLLDPKAVVPPDPKAAANAIVDSTAKIPSGVLWAYTIHPTEDIYEADSGSTSAGPPGLGGRGGGTGQDRKKVAYLQAAAPAVLAGQMLLVPARDGSLLAFDKNLGVDFTPPKVDMLFPNAGDQVSGQPPLLFYFRISDDSSGLKEDTIKVEVNGQPLDYKLSRDGTILVRFTQTGKNRALSDGRKEIVVTAADWMGNVVQKKFALTIDNALPPIKLSNDNNQGGPGGGFGKGGGGGGGDLGGG